MRLPRVIITKVKKALPLVVAHAWDLLKEVVAEGSKKGLDQEEAPGTVHMTMTIHQCNH